MQISKISMFHKVPCFSGHQNSDRTVAVLGSSKSSESIMDAMNVCSAAVKTLVQADKNILTGCSTRGIMGAAYNSAKENSILDDNGRKVQNLVIIKQPLWGDEDLGNCVILGSANTEAERIEKFYNNADSFLIFPGGPTTLQEATTLISKNHYREEGDRKKIVLVGKEYFKGLTEQYDTLYKQGLLRCEPEELFTIVDREDEIIDNFKK